MSKKRNSASWSNCKRVLQRWPSAGVVALMQELYRLSDENRRYLHARLLAEQQAQTLEEVKRKIARLLSPSIIDNDQFRHADVKRVIDQYERATNDPAAVAELLLA